MHTRKLVSAILGSGLLLLASGWLNPARALLASHDCSFCHDFHGAISNAGLLKYSSSEVLCLSCHNMAINDTKAAAVHNPLNLASNQMGYITCRECHNPHDNINGNIKLIGFKYDPSTGRRFTLPTLRVELPTSNPATPVYKTVTFQTLADFNKGTGSGACEICHSGNHNAGQDCTTCHGHDAEFKASGSCTTCHTGSGTGALAVGPDSPHSTTITGFSCSECHSGHGSGTVEIPNNPDVGINYIGNGEAGIALGSSTVTGASEAEICWNCHASKGVSEWGTNTHAATGNSSYHYGSLNQTSWIGASWSSPNFSYKSGTIRSTHSVNKAATGPGVDAVGSIRCSYCHDVHELALASGDSAAGKPYLRGSWKGNPYPEDGAPSGAWNAYTSPLLKWGGVPRGLNTNNTLGGYQIDQNNGNPTSGWTVGNSAGLCLLCHQKNRAGNNVTVDSLDWFGTNDWVGSNGHSNAVLGGTGANIFNVYSPSTRAEGTAYNNPSMAYNNVTTYGSSDWMYGLRNLQGGSYAYLVGDTTADNDRGVTPPIYIGTSGNQRYTYKTAISWGVDFSTTTPQTQYHQFSCSKCHNPHASRLPRLMITNCLDVQRNSWDGNFINDLDWTSGKTNVAYNFSTSNIFKTEFRGTSDSQGLRNKQLAYAKSAQNCHRYVDVDGDRIMDAGDEPGWNKVTPW